MTRFDLAGKDIFSFTVVYTYSEGHPVASGGCIPGAKAAGAPPSIAVLKNNELYFHNPMCLHDIVLNHLIKYTVNF
jgi:hypothetical protein